MATVACKGRRRFPYASQMALERVEALQTLGGMALDLLSLRSGWQARVWDLWLQGNGPSLSSAISPGGRFIAFVSWASNLVPGDTNDTYDIFVHDRQTGTTERVSVSSGSAQGNSNSIDPAISAGGRFVAFLSEATNLVPGDTNEQQTSLSATARRARPSGSASAQAALRAMGLASAWRSRRTGASSPLNRSPTTWCQATPTNSRTSLSATARRARPSGSASAQTASRAITAAPGRRFPRAGASSPSISGPPTWCRATINDTDDVFVRDRQTGTTNWSASAQAAPRAITTAPRPAISPDGRFIAFGSSSTNLVPGDTNGEYDVFVRSLAP